MLKEKGIRPYSIADGKADVFIDDLIRSGSTGLISEPYCDFKAMAKKYPDILPAGEGDNRVLTYGTKEDIRKMVESMAETIEDAVCLLPLDVTKGRIPVIVEATRLCREKLRDEVFVKTCIDSAPFSAAAALLGPAEWMVSLLDEPELCHKLLEISAESVVNYGVAVAKAGAHGIAFGDSSAGLVSREMYEEFALPYAKQVIRELHERTGLPVFYHICGDTRHMLDLMVETGADCIEIDSKVPMKLAKEIAAGKCAVEGNVSTVEAFLMGTPEDVKREAEDILDLFGNRGGLILSSACEVPRKSPMENIRALTDAARNYEYK